MKPFVKRQENVAADVEAICEATSRPNMRFVAVKSEEQQARGMMFRSRGFLVRRRTQTFNALPGHRAIPAIAILVPVFRYSGGSVSTVS